MFQLTRGQVIAADWFGLAPWWWGWIIAGIAVAIAVACWTVRRPRVLEPSPTAEPLSMCELRWLWGAVLVGGMALHFAGILGGFNIFDDQRQIHWDPVITELTPENLWTTAFGNYRGTNQELMYLSFQLNWLVAGKQYWAWYLVNWLLFAPLMLLVGRLGYRLTGDKLVGILAMAVLAVTPIMAELLSWISVRSHLFGLILAMGACVAYLEMLHARGRGRWGWLVVSLLAFVASQFSKPVFIFVPAWLVLFDVYLGRRDGLRAALEKLPYLLVAGGFAYKIVVTGAGNRLIRPDPLGGSYYHTVLQDLNLLVEYGRTLFVPAETGLLPHFNVALGWLSIDGTPQVLANGFAPLASLLILLSVAAVVAALRVRFGWGLPALWLLAAGVTFATVLNIPFRGTAAAFEYRYTFTAQVITAVLLGAAMVALLRSRMLEHRLLRVVPAALCVAYLVWGATVTNANRHAWSSSEALWTRNADLYPRSFYSQYYAGKALQHASKNYEAVQHLLEAKRFNVKNDLMLHKRLGDNLYYIDDFEGAKEHWLIYFRKKPSKITERYEERFVEVGLTQRELRQRR